MINRTLCGCLAFTEAQYWMDRTDRIVHRHYRANPQCREKALQSPIWQAREPIGGKQDIGEEHDPEYGKEE